MPSLRIGRLFGIPIKLDVTFLLVLPLFAFLIGRQVGPIAEALGVLDGEIPVEPLTVGWMPWLLGLAATLGLFAGVVLHELGHSLVAMQYDVEIDSITLWIFGGIARFRTMPEEWRQELTVAIAGPIVSVLIGVACYVTYFVIPSGMYATRFVVGYLAILNLVLAAFNMLPGFPMDGGRILRALLARSRPHAEATRIAAEVGKGFAVFLGFVGILAWNIIMIGLAFFIFIAAAAESRQTTMKAAFEGITVDDIMTPAIDLHTVSPDIAVGELLDRMLRQRHTGYPVVHEGDVVGMVTLSDVRDVAPSDRNRVRIADVMSTDLLTIDRHREAMDAMERVTEEDVGRLLVTDDRERVVGLLSRTDLMTALEVIRSRGQLNGVTIVDDRE